MDLSEYLNEAQARVAWERFRPDIPESFEVQLRFCERPELEKVHKRFSNKSVERLPDGTKQWRDVADLPGIRKYLAEHCLTGWRGLTFGAVATLCNLQTPNGDRAAWAGKEVPFSPKDAQVLLERALGFEDFVWTRVTQMAEERAREEARELETSAATRGDSQST